MTTQQQRDAFEGKFPVPDSAHWDEDISNYVPVRFTTYRAMWKAWQAAQAQQGEGEPVAFWDGDTGEAETAFQFEQDSIYRTPVYTHPQPAHQVPEVCPDCKSDQLTWRCIKTANSGVQDGRLKLNEVDCLFVLGCDECSETVKALSGDQVAALLTSPGSEVV